MKYKVGDKATIRKNLALNESYKGLRVTQSMLLYCGKEVTIKGLDSFEICYKIDLDQETFGWTEEMFEVIVTPITYTEEDLRSLAYYISNSNTRDYTITQLVENWKISSDITKKP